jgi:hypothetical protein
VAKTVTLAGWSIASKEVTTKKGEPVEFWAFEDEADVFHCVLFPTTTKMMSPSARFFIDYQAKKTCA